MVLRAKAGTRLSVVEAALDAHGQMLPFEPIDHRLLYGNGGEPTIGGLVAVNASGPRRVSAGAARDSLIGLRLVNGRGEAVASGGRVMKNVAGLDLVKINCGALGTLGFLTEATFKLLPKPESEATIVIRRLDDAQAIAAMTLALGSAYGISGAAALSPGMGREFARTFLRVEGFADSVEYRAEQLLALLVDFGAERVLRGGDSRRLWRGVRDAEFLVEPRERAVWRVGLRPSRAVDFVARLGPRALAHFFDWGGGLVWLATDPTPADAAAVRAALKPLGGHATLDPRARRVARRDRRLRAAVRAARRADPAGQGGLRSRPPHQPRADVRGRCEDDANPLRPRAARRSAHAGAGKDRALLHPLRLLHRDLSDLCRHRRRARSPRGRIYLIKDLLESGRAPTADDVWPIDHCLSCNACMTTCPSGVDYRRLIDHARVLVETRYRRPLADRLMRAVLARLLPSRNWFAPGLNWARWRDRSRL